MLNTLNKTMKITDNEFKDLFKRICLENYKDLANPISNIFDLPDDHFARCYTGVFKYSKRNEVNELINDIYSRECHIIYDNLLEYNVGCNEEKNVIKMRKFISNLSENPKFLKFKFEEEFDSYCQKKYWKDKNKIDLLNSIENKDFFKERLPITQREKIASANPHIKRFKFFNAGNILNYHKQLINIFFPDFKYDKKISNKKILRFKNNINDELAILISANYAILERELKMFYIEIPNFEFEIASNELTKAINPKYYLSNQDTFPIVRIKKCLIAGNHNLRDWGFFRK
jgi:hypothetical protein